MTSLAHATPEVKHPKYGVLKEDKEAGRIWSQAEEEAGRVRVQEEEETEGSRGQVECCQVIRQENWQSHLEQVGPRCSQCREEHPAVRRTSHDCEKEK